MVDEPGPVSEEELLERLQEEMRRITVPDYLGHLLVSLSSMAFQRLGLTSDTAADRDLAQARMAIDAFEALAGVLSRGPSEQDASLYTSTLHQMRMAFVRVSDEASADAGAPAGDGAAGDEDVNGASGGAGGSGEAGADRSGADVDDAADGEE